MQQLVADYQAGIHTPELVTKYTLSKTSVLKILRDNNVTLRRQSMTPEQIAAAIQHYEDGKSLNATAREIGMPKQSVRNALLRAGVIMRPSTRVAER
jgi:flagellar biosynthesis/type III secretory pathway chaperone